MYVFGGAGNEGRASDGLLCLSLDVSYTYPTPDLSTTPNSPNSPNNPEIIVSGRWERLTLPGRMTLITLITLIALITMIILLTLGGPSPRHGMAYTTSTHARVWDRRIFSLPTLKDRVGVNADASGDVLGARGVQASHELLYITGGHGHGSKLATAGPTQPPWLMITLITLISVLSLSLCLCLALSHMSVCISL